MTLGLSSKFNILQQSPHDLQTVEPPRDIEAGPRRWVPSRYNVHAVTSDDRLVLWNSYRGSMCVFQPAQGKAIKKLLRKPGFEARCKGIVQYLYDRGFLVEEGTNEYRRIQLGFGREQYRSDRLELILLSSEDCNFRCQYCYEDFTRGTMQPWVRAGIKKLVEGRLPSLRTLTVLWFGGEPLYGWSAIEELAPFFQQVADEHRLAFGSSMTTNGYLLTPEVAEKLLSWRVRSFQVTIDGAPEDHDRNRPARDGQGTFATIFSNLHALSARPDSFQVDVRVNFDRNNHPHITEFLDLLEQSFGHDPRFRLRFRAVGKWGGPKDEQLATCGVGESTQIQLQLREEARRRNLNVTEDLRDIHGMGAQVCYAARPYNLVIGATGQVMKCTVELDKNDRNVVGQINADGELRLNEDRMALWTEPAFERDTKCQKCVVLPTCQGIYCPLIRIESNQSPCTPLRLTVKKEMLGTVEAAAESARRLVV